MAVLLGSGIGLAVAGSATATTGTPVVSPNSGVSPGATLNVSATGVLSAADSQPFTGLVALSQCGNADSSGVALASISTADCDGAAQIAHIKFATVTSGSLPATAFPIRESGIGANNRRCVPVPPGTLPCQIGIGDVGTAGTNVAIAGTYTLVAAPPETTTTTSVTTTTTTIVPVTTTTTPKATTTTRVTVPAIAAPGAGGGGVLVSAGVVNIAAPTTVPGPALATTGLGTGGWWTLGIGLALLDLGYLALSSTKAKSRRRFRRA